MHNQCNITQEEAERLLSKINRSIAAICNEYGLTFEKLKGNYTQEAIKFNGLISWTVNGKTRHENNFIRHAKELGLNEDWMNFYFFYQGENYEIIGLDPNKYSYPIFIYNITKNKSFHISPDKLKHIWSCSRKTPKKTRAQ